MRGSRAVISLVLVIATLLCAVAGLTSCNRSYDKDEVEAAAKELLPKALVLYSIYYGNGLGYIDSGYSDGDYREVSPVSLRKYGFTTLAELKTMTLATFSTEYSEKSLFSYFLESYEADGIVYNYARYTENATGEYILVNKNHKPIFEDRMDYKLDTVTAVGSTKDFVNLTVVAVVKNEKGEAKERTLDFTMYEEKSGWRISSPCFANYIKDN